MDAVRSSDVASSSPPAPAPRVAARRAPARPAVVLPDLTPDALALFQSLPDAALVIYLPTGVVVQWNAAAQALFGHTPSEAAGMPLTALLPPDLTDLVRLGLPLPQNGAQTSHAAPTGRPSGSAWDHPVELPALHRDGRELTVEVRLGAVGPADGRYALLTARDTATRRHAWEARQVTEGVLSASERLLERFTDLVETTGTASDPQTIFRCVRELALELTPSDSIFISRYDPERRERTCLYAHSEGEDMDVSVLPPMPLSGSPHSLAVERGELVLANDLQAALRQSGAPTVHIGLDVDPRLPRASLAVPMIVSGRILGALEVQSTRLGAYTRQHVTPMRVAAGLTAAALERLRLVDEFQQRAEHLRRSEERFHKAFNASPVATSIRLLSDGRYIDVNESFVRLLGYTREEVVGRTVQELGVWANEAQREAVEHTLRRKRWIRGWEGAYRTKRGDILEMLISAELIDVAGEECILSLAHDVTERNRLLAHVREQEKALRAQVAELRRSRRQITAAEERLRREIAELLHGRVQTQLLVVDMRLGDAQRHMEGEKRDPATASLRLSEARELLERIREREVRMASHVLHPSVVRIGLVPAVQLLSERFGDRFTLDIQADPQIRALDDPLDNKIPEDIRLVAYRVVEEALGNVVKHAGATHVDVAFSLDGGQALSLQVRDNGKGFDPERERHGLGLSSITGRVDQAGGAWDLISSPGAGTTVAVRLPLHQNSV